MSKKLSYPEIPMDGKTVIVTGGNSGIGKEAAKQLARLGARVILACRSKERGEKARDEIIQETGSNNVVFMQLDLSSLESVKNFADNFNKSEDRLDVLINNAGVVTKERIESVDGIELTFAVNHIGHFHLTNLLLDKLKASAPSRVLNLTSLLHKFADWDHKDPQYERRFQGLYAYGRTKTTNILHIVQLAKILEGTGVTCYAVHPGAVSETDITRNYGGSQSWLMRGLWFFAGLFGDKNISIEDGAKTTLYCALEPSIAEHSGRYYEKCGESKAKAFAMNPESAQRLWDYSVELCASK